MLMIQQLIPSSNRNDFSISLYMLYPQQEAESKYAELFIDGILWVIGTE